MKKLLLVAAMLFAVTVSNAQLLKLGVKGGVSFLSYDVKSVSDAQSRIESGNMGFTAGLMSRITVPLAGIYLQPELNYNFAKYDVTNTDGTKTGVSYNNLELPVLLGWKLLFLRVNLGPVFNLSTFGDDVERPNVGYQAGAGLSLGKIELDARYQGYFKDDNSSFSINQSSGKTSVNDGFWVLTLGYMF